MKDNNLAYSLLLLIAVTIPFNIPGTYSVLPISALIVFVALRYRSSLAVPNEAKFLSLPFFIYVIWSLASLTKTGSLSFLEAALPFFIFPLFLSQCRINRDQFRWIMLSYIGAVIISYLTSVIAAIYHFRYSTPRWGRPSDFFFHVQFTDGLWGIHPTYYGLMGCVAALFTALTLRGWKRLLIILMLTVFIFMVNARITIMIHTLVIVIFLGRELFQTYRWKSIAIIMVIGGALYFLSDLFGSIYDYPHRQIALDVNAAWERSDDPDIHDAEGGLITRFAIWRNALETIEEKPWFGQGFQNEKQALMQKAIDNHSPAFLIENARAFNSHNQALSYLINFGIAGSLFFLLYFSILLNHICKKKNWIALSFFLIFFVCGLTESVFERMWGIILFTFFNSLFVLKPDDQND